MTALNELMMREIAKKEMQERLHRQIKEYRELRADIKTLRANLGLEEKSGMYQQTKQETDHVV